MPEPAPASGPPSFEASDPAPELTGGQTRRDEPPPGAADDRQPRTGSAGRPPDDDLPADEEEARRQYARPARTPPGGLYRDGRQGIRIDREGDREPGHPYPRVLISFRDDARPTPDERARLKDEGFKFDGRSWGKPLSAASVELAKRLVNDLLKARGDEYQLYI